MNIKIVYHSSTGNTKKVAEAIAAELQLSAQEIGSAAAAICESVDLLFLGDGVYAGNPHKATISFIESLNPQMVKAAAVFATYGGQDAIGENLKQRLEEKGIQVLSAPYTCRGKSFILANRKHPNQDELQGARIFAKKLAEQLG